MGIWLLEGSFWLQNAHPKRSRAPELRSSGIGTRTEKEPAHYLEMQVIVILISYDQKAEKDVREQR